MKALRYLFLISSALLLFAACSEPVEETQSGMEQTFPDDTQTEEQAQTETQTQTPMEEESLQEIQGEVVSVSPDDQTMTVRSDAGEEIEVTYNADTQVSGSQEGTQGLATVQGSRVRITYQEGMLANTAVEIEVEPSSPTGQ